MKGMRLSVEGTAVYNRNDLVLDQSFHIQSGRFLATEILTDASHGQADKAK